jgi:hypothetical protein
MEDLKQYNTFKRWLDATYTDDDFYNIYHSGCQNGISGMIYYSETIELYDAFADDLHDIINEYHNMTGDMPQSIIKELGYASGFKNAVVWFCAEWLADEYITRKQTEEEEEA